MANPRALLQTLGLHPLAAFGLVAVDWMMFSGEVLTAETALAITVPVGFALGLACSLIQRHAFNDSWGAALGKGLVMGVLTAIPTGLPSILTGMGGMLGVLNQLLPSLTPTGADAAAAPQIAPPPGPVPADHRIAAAPPPVEPASPAKPASPDVIDVQPE